MSMKTGLNDPLQSILERHLIELNSQGKDLQVSNELINQIAHEYLAILQSQGVHIPGPVRDIFLFDLKEEIRELTIKKTFGNILPETDVSKAPLKKSPKIA